MKRIVCAAVLACSLGGNVFAQDVEDGLAREILDITGEADTALAAISEMMPLIESSVRQAYPDLSTRQYMQIMRVYSEEFASSRDDFVEVFVEVYTDEFDESELRALLEFYHSEIGQRWAQALPRIQEQAARAGEQVGMNVDRRALPRVQAIILGEAADK